LTAAAGRILRNSAWGLAGEVASGALFFLAFVLLARYLGASQFGTFSFVLALTGLFQVLADFGLTTILVRDMSRDRSNAASKFSAAALLFGLISVATIAIVGQLGYWWSSSLEVLSTCLVMGAASAVTFQSAAFAAICRAHEDMGFNAAASITLRLAIVVLVFGAIRVDAGMTGIAVAYLLGSLVQCLFFCVVVRTRYFPVSWRIDGAYWKYLLAQSYLVGLGMVFRRSVVNAGTLFLAALATPHATGLFSAGLRIMQIIELIPSTLSMPLLPPFSRFAQESTERLFQGLGHAMRIFAVIGFPLCACVLLLAGEIMRFTFGPGYGDAALVLSVMSLAIALFFPTSLYLIAFSVLGRQRFYTISTGLCLAVNVSLDIALIPSLGAMGAAIAIVASELAFFACGFFILRQENFGYSIFSLFSRPLFATCLTSPILMAVDQSDSLPALVAYTLAFGLTYILLIFALKGIRNEDLAIMKSAFRPRFNAQP
jgi:O-antigen/teichoic acid export membrane protein